MNKKHASILVATFLALSVVMPAIAHMDTGEGEVESGHSQVGQATFVTPGAGTSTYHQEGGEGGKPQLHNPSDDSEFAPGDSQGDQGENEDFSTSTDNNGEDLTTPEDFASGTTSTESMDENEVENFHADERRGEVASSTDALLHIADQHGDIGDQIREIAQTQEESHTAVEDSLANAHRRNSIVSFLIGPDFAELKKAQDALSQYDDAVSQLASTTNQLPSSTDKLALQQQVQTLQQVKQQVATRLDTIQNQFSLFGWLFQFLSGGGNR